MRWLRAVMIMLVIGGLLMALVASHGCSVEGSSPAQLDATHLVGE